MGLGFSWSTFFVEIVNFVILIWLLKRFLYRPVMQTIAQREERIKGELQRAKETETKAAELKQRYETRLAEWEREKTQLREQFDAEITGERTEREAELKAVLEREHRQDEAARAVRERDERQRMWRRAAQDAGRFGARLLSRVASPQLEERLISATVEDLRSLPGDKRATLAAGLNGHRAVTITTRYAIDEAKRLSLGRALEACLGAKADLTFKLDDALISGIRIELGSATVEGTLAGELAWFTQTEADAAS
jgi:F-type H+-transporting ATPase subunit b